MSSPIGFAIVVSAILAIIVILGAPFTMIIMGSLNLQDCPAKTYIPIFLIVSGKMLKVYPILHYLAVSERNKTKYFRLRLSDEVSTEKPETDLRQT